MVNPIDSYIKWLESQEKKLKRLLEKTQQSHKETREALSEKMVNKTKPIGGYPVGSYIEWLENQENELKKEIEKTHKLFTLTQEALSKMREMKEVK